MLFLDIYTFNGDFNEISQADLAFKSSHAIVVYQAITADTAVHKGPEWRHIRDAPA